MVPTVARAGAVRELTRFLCKGSTSHDPNDYTGQTNYQELTSIYSDTGYIRHPRHGAHQRHLPARARPRDRLITT